ncbi:MAG TPA: putative metal-binding motif-containing protein [Polyangiaceae bacterium]|jgi:hypothetical protein
MFVKQSLAIGFFAAIVAQGCGARSQLQPCQRDSDCATVDMCATWVCQYDTKIHDKACIAIAHTSCDDGNPCTTDACDKHTGECSNTWVTLDVDGDGHRGPLAGHQPGDPGSCGDDCDDTDPRAFPGNAEVCDGVDNDCDGIIDNGATYTPTLGSEFQLSKPSFDWAEPDSFVRGSPKSTVDILASYDGTLGGQLSPFLQPLDGTGKPTIDPFVLTGSDAAGSGTSVAWTGDRFGIAWSDRRDGNYEIYFALLDPTGKKMAPGDERITVSDGYSLYPSLVWTGQGFALVWQEERSNGDFKLQGQRLDLEGRLVGNIMTLTSGATDDQGPSLAAGRTELGLVWVQQKSTSQAIVFQTFGFDLTGAAPSPVTLTTPSMDGEGSSLVYDKKNDRYISSFFDASPAKRVVYGTVIGKDAKVIVPPTDVGKSPAQERDVSLLALGDRVLFVYADDRDQNSGYELYAHTLSADLSTELQPPTRVTAAPGDSISPIMTFATDGTALVLFRDDRGPNPAVFETGLKCVMPTP